MSRLMKMLHDAWCGLTGSCSPPPVPVDTVEKDDYIDWLKKEKRDSEHRVQEQAPNRIEVAYLYDRLNGKEAADHGSHS